MGDPRPNRKRVQELELRWKNQADLGLVKSSERKVDQKRSSARKRAPVCVSKVALSVFIWLTNIISIIRSLLSWHAWVKILVAHVLSVLLNLTLHLGPNRLHQYILRIHLVHRRWLLISVAWLLLLVKLLLGWHLWLLLVHLLLNHLWWHLHGRLHHSNTLLLHFQNWSKVWRLESCQESVHV